MIIRIFIVKLGVEDIAVIFIPQLMARNPLLPSRPFATNSRSTTSWGKCIFLPFLYSGK